MKWIKQLQQVLKIAVFVASAASMAAVQAGAAVQEALASPSALTTIQSVQVSGEGAGASLIVTSSAPVTYTSYKTTAPHRLVIDFSQATPAENISPISIGKGAFKSVMIKRYDTDAGVLTRMEIELVQDAEGVIEPATDKSGVIKISFPGYKPVTEEITSATAVAGNETSVNSATVPAAQKKSEDTAVKSDERALVTAVTVQHNNIVIQASGLIGEYKTFRLNKPERVVIDISNAKAAPELKMVQINSAGISTARIGNYADKVRIVFDALSGGLRDAKVTRGEKGLLISFESGSVAEPVQPVIQTQQTTTTSEKAAVAVAEPPVSSPKPVVEKKSTASSIVPQIEAIDFQALEGVSRVAIKVSGSPVTEEPQKSAGFVSFKIKGTQLPKSLQRSYEAREFNTPVLRITPIQVRTKAGVDTVIRVAMRAEATYQLRRETDIIYLEFKHPITPAAVGAGVTQKASQSAKQAASEPAPEQELVVPIATGGKRVYSGRKVTLEFADAEVRKIFQLLSEVSNKNFVLGDEVTGTISLKLVNVPWDQALDIILDTKGLDKREEGNIVLIRGKGKFKSLLDEEVEIRKTALKSEPLETAMFDVNYADIATITSQFAALKTDRGTITQDTRTNKVIVKDVKTALNDMRILLKNLDVPERQVMIEARIVEATASFTRSLGVNWGVHYRDGSASIAGINSFDSSFGGLASNVAPATGVSGQPGASAGISFGTLASNIKLDMRLNAAVSAGLIRIVSTPRVATLNHKSAKITQGQQIPYTASTADKIETKFIEAALALEVTPHINPNGTIVLKIDAKNDAPGSGGNPPPINKKQATTEMMLRDGETTVIGGIFVERDAHNEDGVPFLKDVPFFGGLFKSDSVEKTRTELLIFITPRILTNA